MFVYAEKALEAQTNEENPLAVQPKIIPTSKKFVDKISTYHYLRYHHHHHHQQYLDILLYSEYITHT